MMSRATYRAHTRLTLPERRAAVLARIHVKREQTAVIGRLVVLDLRATERSRRSMMAGLTVLKTSLIVAGVIWSLNASSTALRGRRLFTIALSVISTLRAMRKVATFLIPPTQSPRTQG